MGAGDAAVELAVVALIDIAVGHDLRRRVRDLAVENSVNVKTLQLLAFGEYQEHDGQVYPASYSESEDAGEIMASGAVIAGASGTYRVPFGQNYPVSVYVGQSNGEFENNVLLLTDQNKDNTSIMATVKIASGSVPQITSIAFSGDGGSIYAGMPISQSITSSGPLGDLYLNQNNTPVNVTAPSIFGNIDMDGQISGVIQTTGQRVDAVSGLTAAVPADLGSTHVLNGTTVATTVNSEGTMTGQLISRGNLVSQVQLGAGMSGGLIVAQGNLGAWVGAARVGGLTSNGAGFGGQLVVLGNVWGDISISGGLKSGRLAFSGNDYGNLTISGGVNSASAIVGRGIIGSATYGTHFHLDSLSGILAVEGAVSASGSYSSGNALFNKTNMGSPNANSSAVDAIFSSGGQTLGLDVSGLDLQGLSLISTDLAALHVASGALTGPTP